MAIKKLTNKVDDSDLDFDLDFNFEDDFEKDLQGPTKERSPVARSFSGAVKGVKSTVTNTAFIEKNVRKALPKEYGEIYDTTKQITSFVPQLYDEAVREVKPALQTTVKSVKKLIPQEMKRTNKLFQKLSELVGEPADERSISQERENEISSELSSIFLEQAKTYSEDRAEDLAKEDIREALGAKRHKNEMELLSTISVGVRSLSTYNERVNAAYQKKTLELQYRSYFLQQDLLKTTREYFTVFKQQNENIVKNTSLPDLVKMKKSEQFADIARQKFFNKIQQKLFNNSEYLDNVIQKTKKGFKKQLSKSSNNLLQTTPDALNNIRQKLQKIQNSKHLTTPSNNSILDAGKKTALVLLKSMTDSFGVNNTLKSDVENIKQYASPAIFNNLSQKSLVSIIPGYLARIYREIQVLRTGNDKIPLTEFDLTTNKFATKKQILSSTKDLFTAQLQKNDYASELRSGAKELLGDATDSTDVQEAFAKIINRINFSENTGSITSEQLLDPSLYEGMDPKLAQKVQDAISKAYDKNDIDTERKEMVLARKVSDIKSRVGDIRGYIQGMLNTDRENVLMDLGLIKKNSAGDTEINMDRYRDLSMETPSGQTVKREYRPKSGKNVGLGILPYDEVSEPQTIGDNKPLIDAIANLTDKLTNTPLPKDKASAPITENETLITISQNVIDIRKLLEMRRAEYEMQKAPDNATTNVLDKLSQSGQSGWGFIKNKLFPNLKSLGSKALDKAEEAKDYVANFDEEKIDGLLDKASEKKRSLFERGKNAKDSILNWLDKTGLTKKAKGALDKAEEAKDYVANLDEQQVNELLDKGNASKDNLLQKGKRAKDSIVGWFNQTGLTQKAENAKDSIKGSLDKETFKTKFGNLKTGATNKFKTLSDFLFSKKETDTEEASEAISEEAQTEEGRSYLDVIKEAIKLKALKIQEGIEKYKEKHKVKKETDKSKPAFNDKDGDGVRDGAWQTLIGKAKRYGFKGEVGKPAEAKYTGGKAVISGLFGAAGGLFDMLKNGAGGLADLFSLGKDALTGKIGKGQFFKSVLSTMGGLVPESFAGTAGNVLSKGGKGALTLGKEGIKGAYGLGKQGLKGLGQAITSDVAKEGFKKTIAATRSLDKRLVLGGLNVAKEGLLWGGKTALKAPGALLKGAWNVAKFGLPLLGETGMAAGAALAPLLLNPITLAIGGGLAAYGLYKYATRNKASDVDIVRLRQYGLTEDNKSNYHQIFKLEKLVQEKVLRYYEQGVQMNQAALNDEDLAREILDIFDIDEQDQERQAAFSQWFLQRFQPVIEKHAHALFLVNKKLQLDETDKLKSKELERYLNSVKGIPDSVYAVRTSPFEDVSELTATKQDAETVINNLLSSIKKEGEKVDGGGKHVLEKIDPSIKSSVVMSSVVPTGLASKAFDYLKNKGKSVLDFVSNTYTSAKGFFKRGLEAIGGSSVARFLTGLFSSIVAPIDKILTDNLSAFTALRLKAYGLPKLEMSKVNSLISLEAKLAQYVKMDGKNNAVFKGDIEEVLAETGKYFGISSPSDPRAGDWIEWFKDRFLPIYLTYIGTSYQYCKTTNPATIMASLRESDQYDVGMKILGVKDIWDVKTSPWSDMPLNVNPQSVENNLNYLKDKTKDRILKEQGSDSSTKDENAKSVQRLAEEGKLESSFLGKLWGDTKNIASRAWNATKEVVGGAWDSVKEGAGKAWDTAKTYAGKAMTAMAGDQGETEPSDKTQTQGGYSVGGKGMVPVDEQQGHSTRKLPITDKLKALLARAGAAAGLDKVVVFSGGQPPTGSNRVGSHRHDFGNAADIRLVKDGKHLAHESPNDLPYYKSFAKIAASLGATGIGAGPGYMGPTAMHVGFGPKSIWGRGGKSAYAPEWLKQAVNAGWKGTGDGDAFKIMTDATNTTQSVMDVRNRTGATGTWNTTNEIPEQEPTGGYKPTTGATGTWGESVKFGTVQNAQDTNGIDASPLDMSEKLKNNKDIGKAKQSDSYELSWLPNVLKNAGLKVITVEGWQTRKTPGSFGPIKGVLCHHTGSKNDGKNTTSLQLIINGRPDLQGPLSQLYLSRDGTFYVVSAGRCNHAGKGGWFGITSGNTNLIGIEAENAGIASDPWPETQLDAYARGVAAILNYLKLDSNACLGHKEYAPRRKIDPSFDMGDFRARVSSIMKQQKTKTGTTGTVLGSDTTYQQTPSTTTKSSTGNTSFKLDSNVVNDAFPITTGTSMGSPTTSAAISGGGDSFSSKAPWIMKNLMSEFGLTAVQAAAILGNLGHESGGFKYMREIGKSGNSGGFGWAQWTYPPRKRGFMEYAKQRGLDWKSDEANYGYLVQELKGPYSGAIAALKKTSTLEDGVKAFERVFERAALPTVNYAQRNRYGKMALSALMGGGGDTGPDSTGKTMVASSGEATTGTTAGTPSSQPLPGQMFKSLNTTRLPAANNAPIGAEKTAGSDIKTPGVAMSTIPSNSGIVPTSFTPQQQSMYAGFVGPIKPNAMDINSQNRIQPLDKGGSIDFGGVHKTTLSINDTLTKSLDVQTEMLMVLKTVAQTMTPEAFSNLVKGMVPVSTKDTKTTNPITKTQHKRPEQMPKVPVSLARTNV